MCKSNFYLDIILQMYGSFSFTHSTKWKHLDRKDVKIDYNVSAITPMEITWKKIVFFVHDKSIFSDSAGILYRNQQV